MSNYERNGKEDAGRSNPVEALVQFTKELKLYFFLDQDTAASTVIENAGRQSAVRLTDGAFKEWLWSQYYSARKQAASDDVITNAIRVLSHDAGLGGETLEVFTRVGRGGGNVYFDLADSENNVVEITPDGWGVVKDAAIRFRRPANMAEAPRPAQDGAGLDEVGRWFGVEPADLITGWLLQALRAYGPYMLLAILGEKGNGKSTLARKVRRLIDPQKDDAVGGMLTHEGLLIAARNRHVVLADNLSGIRNDDQDKLCRLISGEVFTKRKNYTDDVECSLKACRPVVITSIGDVVTRTDLIDRTLSVAMPPIPAGERRTEESVFGEFDAARPRLLGALFTAMARGLRQQRDPAFKVDELPRMADACRWIEACFVGSGKPPGSFVRLFNEQHKHSSVGSLDAWNVYPVLHGMLLAEGEFQGSMSDLYNALTERADARGRRPRDWPANAHQLRTDLKRYKEALQFTGVARRELPGRNGYPRFELRLELPALERQVLKAVADRPKSAEALREAIGPDVSDDLLHAMLCQERITVIDADPPLVGTFGRRVVVEGRLARYDEAA